MKRYKITISCEADAPVPLYKPNDVFFVEDFMRNEILDRLKLYPFENIKVEVRDQIDGRTSTGEMRTRRID